MFEKTVIQWFLKFAIPPGLTTGRGAGRAEQIYFARLLILWIFRHDPLGILIAQNSGSDYLHETMIGGIFCKNNNSQLWYLTSSCGPF